jgi:hypothetical protein
VIWGCLLGCCQPALAVSYNPSYSLPLKKFPLRKRFAAFPMTVDQRIEVSRRTVDGWYETFTLFATRFDPGGPLGSSGPARADAPWLLTVYHDARPTFSGEFSSFEACSLEKTKQVSVAIGKRDQTTQEYEKLHAEPRDPSTKPVAAPFYAPTFAELQLPKEVEKIPKLNPGPPWLLTMRNMRLVNAAAKVCDQLSAPRTAASTYSKSAP